MKASVIVPTSGRPDKLSACLRSLIKNKFRDFEIIVVDQSRDDQSETVVKKLNSRKIKYFKVNGIGPSLSRNYGIQKSRSGILIFCDDDCIVSGNWVGNILKDFTSYPKISAVFGQVKPFLKTKMSATSCVSCTDYKKKMFLSAPQKSKIVFQGNSMAFKRQIFKKYGFFKEWLGFGRPGMCTEDEEFAFRILNAGETIMIDPLVTSFHDHWVTDDAKYKILKIYSGGFYAAFSYHAFLGNAHALRYLKKHSADKYSSQFKELKDALTKRHPKVVMQILLATVREMLSSYRDMKGVTVGAYYALKDLSGHVK